MSNKKPKNQEIAQDFVRHEDHLKNLLYIEEYDRLYLYNGKYYEELINRKLTKYVHKYIIKNFDNINITKATTLDIIQQIKWLTYETEEVLSTEYISLDDCLMNSLDFTLHPFDRKKRAIHNLSIASQDLDQPIPNFINYLNTTFLTEENEPDLQLIQFVQEMFGHYLNTYMKVPAVFFLYGKGRNGKSVMLDVIQAMIGDRYTSSMSIQTLTTKDFAPQHLIGKKLNVCGEEESKHIKSDKFKNLVSGEMTDSDQKFGDRIEFRPNAKFLFSMNRMITFDSIDDGLKRRIYIVPFNQKFEGQKKDLNLTDKLHAELGGIIGWAIKGSMRLMENNYVFTDSAQIKDKKAEFEEEISSPIKFFREIFEVDDEEFIARDDFYRDYELWCKENGRKSMNSSNFRNDIIDHIPGITYRRKRMTDKSHPWGFNVKSNKPTYKDPVLNLMDTHESL